MSLCDCQVYEGKECVMKKNSKLVHLKQFLAQAPDNLLPTT